jgi:tRNA A-37 threonylcarbamoyl transferase component Bud32/CheY-like chemotaxis protein
MRRRIFPPVSLRSSIVRATTVLLFDYEDAFPMLEIDSEMLVDQVKMLGLVSREQLHEATLGAEDVSPDAVLRMLLRKGALTSWQIDRLKKGDPSGFFFGDAKVLFHLAEGTFARVYRGEHNTNGAPLAIKVLRNRFAMIPEAVDRFHKEAEAGMRLRHPHIVQVIDVGRQENRHFMIMEYVEGMNLRDFMKLRVRIPPEQALPLMVGLAEALNYSMARGVTHRDIKGTNILISNTGVAKLVDFGLATMQGDESKPGVKSQRTVDYSALERTCNSPKGDPRSDIYFLGCVFYQMLTGQLPMEESESKDMLRKMLKRSFGAIKPITEHRYAPDEELSRIITKMMKIELKARYQSMEEVLTELQRYQSALEAMQAKDGTTAPENRAEEALGNLFFADIEAPRTVATEQDQTAAVAAGSAEVKAVPTKSILCVEAQTEIQDALRKQVSAMGYRVRLVSDAERGAEMYRESPVDAVLFDTDGQGSESIEAFIDMHEKAHEEGHQLVALVLLGPRQDRLREKLPEGDRLIVLSKPIKMKQVQDALQQLLPLK